MDNSINRIIIFFIGIGEGASRFGPKSSLPQERRVRILEARNDTPRSRYVRQMGSSENQRHCSRRNTVLDMKRKLLDIGFTNVI